MLMVAVGATLAGLGLVLELLLLLLLGLGEGLGLLGVLGVVGTSSCTGTRTVRDRWRDRPRGRSCNRSGAAGWARHQERDG